MIILQTNFQPNWLQIKFKAACWQVTYLLPFRRFWIKNWFFVINLKECFNINSYDQCEALPPYSFGDIPEHTYVDTQGMCVFFIMYVHSSDVVSRDVLESFCNLLQSEEGTSTKKSVEDLDILFVLKGGNEDLSSNWLQISCQQVCVIDCSQRRELFVQFFLPGPLQKSITSWLFASSCCFHLWKYLSES